MNRLEQSIREKMKKEYRLPHDIEAIAAAIYTLKVADKSDTKLIIADFLESVACSKYSDIVNITYQYLKQLAQNQGKLTDEEYQKIAHLFDSIHIFLDLGMGNEHNVVEKSERLILDLLDKRGATILSTSDTSKPWWNEVRRKYKANRNDKLTM